MTPRYRDRYEAGHALAERLRPYAGRDDVIVLALPRGGVPVGFEVAHELGLPLDLFLVRKLGAPGHEELAMGAIATGGAQLLNHDVVRTLHISADDVEAAIHREQIELDRRERAYRGDRPPPVVEGRTVLIVDDGLATGATMRVAVHALRMENPARIVVAVPVGAAETCDAIAAEADEVVCARTPEPFYAVGMWYQQFDQTSDAEVRDLLAESRAVYARRHGNTADTIARALHDGAAPPPAP